MAWRIDVQPDGRYARFSEVVDSFTDVNMTREEAVDLCHDEFRKADLDCIESCRKAGVDPRTSVLGRQALAGNEAHWRHGAEAKVRRAELDPERWRRDIGTVYDVHGKGGVVEVLQYMGWKAPEIAAKLKEMGFKDSKDWSPERKGTS